MADIEGTEGVLNRVLGTMAWGHFKTQENATKCVDGRLHALSTGEQLLNRGKEITIGRSELHDFESEKVVKHKKLPPF